MQRDNLSRHLSTLFLSMVLILSVLLNGCQSDSDQPANKPSEKNSSAEILKQTEPPDFAKLVGRWLRPDGGYVVEIQKVDINGTMQAAYYNPRSINVSQALAAQKEGIIEVFIELRDTGYPGATYTLKYDKANDILVGLYYQPAAGQTFDVQFVRKE